MTLKNRNGNTYGDSHEDIRSELLDYSKNLAEHFANAVCSCNSNSFRLSVDDTEGAALRTCGACGQTHPIGDSADYLEDANLEQCECPCGKDLFKITVGISLYRDSEDVRWIYLGCRCVQCGLTACYADWRNECPNYKELLSRV